MKRALIQAAVIGGGFFAMALFVGGSSPLAMTLALFGIVGGLLAATPITEFLLEEQRHANEKTAAVAWIDQDPYGFAKRIADVFADELETAEGDKLAEAVLGAEDLATSLNENVRIATIRKREDLLRSRTWLP